MLGLNKVVWEHLVLLDKWTIFMSRLPCSQCQVWLVYLQSRLLVKVSRNIIREVCSYLHCRLFAAVLENRVQVYNILRHESSTHILSLNFGFGCSCIPLNCENLMCIGGEPPSKQVLEFDMLTSELRALEGLCTARCAAGVAKVADCAYVFGGMNDKQVTISSCEVYSLKHRKWRRLRNDMLERRRNFTPCVHNDLVYLVGFRENLETFSPATEEFHLLTTVSLPLHRVYEYTASFIVNDELFVLNHTLDVARWKINSDQMFTKCETNRGCWSSQSVVVDKGVAYIANNLHGRVEKFCVDRCEFID